MTKPILLLDMDGPIADFDQAFWDLCKAYDWELDIESLDDPGRKRFLTDNMPNETQRKIARRHVEGTRWFRDLPTTPGAKEGVAELHEYFDIWVCTKPLEANTNCRDDKAHWLRWTFPELEDKLIIAPDKSRVSGAVLLDDAPKWVWMGRADWVPVIFRSGFNQAGSLWGRVRHHWSWGEPLGVLFDAAEMYASGSPRRGVR